MNRYILLAILLTGTSLHLLAQEIRHPLDPLTWQEYWTVLKVLQEADHLDGDTRFSMVNLKEPDKALVLKWTTDNPVPRSAFALVRQGDKAYEAVVDLVKRQLTAWAELTDVQPNWLEEELFSMTDEIKENEDFIEAMSRRGIEDLTLIDCYGLPPGYFNTEEDRGRRIAHIRCEDPRDARNLWIRQIAGLTVVVDLNQSKVLRVVDEGAVPMATVSADYDQATLGDPRAVPGPIRIEQPLGPGFKRDGYRIEWQKWRFHVRPDQRVGMILSTVTYQDGDEDRSVLYQGNLSEIFVPYMDPSFSWYARNFLDAGEYALGGLSKPLMQGLDCPDHAEYIDALVAVDNGRPHPVSRMICLFE